jgi:hypothetical protein
MPNAGYFNDQVTGRLAALSGWMVPGFFLHRRLQMVLHLPVEHPLRQPLLQLINQAPLSNTVAASRPANS